MFSKTALHAIRALIVLAELPEGTYAGAGALAERIDAPRNYLGKLLQTLSHEGLVNSQKGLGGGFALARAASEISLFDVVEPIEHVARWEGCILGQSQCGGDSPCVIHDRWGAIRDSYLDLLKDTRISDLAAKSGRAVEAV